jgi:tetraprenyl-beta-curcumene synthase
VVLRSLRALLEANAFASSAAIYWLDVFPHVKHEVGRWRESAVRIPDRRLAELALETQAEERGNLEGSAVFALLAPRSLRGEVIRAAVAFQVLYDFLDTLAELPVEDPVANGLRLHAALLAALDPARPLERYLEHSGFATEHGEYVEELVCACRRSLAALPSYAAVSGLAQQAARRMVTYQSLNHDPADRDRCELRRWALALTPLGSGLQWWETAAAAASSLGVFALIAAAARPALSAADARAAADAYFPWVGAMHVLLDSLVDREVDLSSGEHSLVEHYAGAAHAGARLRAIALQATRRLVALQQGSCHGRILTAMASYYLSRPAARNAASSPATALVLDAVGPHARPAMAMLSARSAVGRLLESQVVDFPLAHVHNRWE